MSKIIRGLIVALSVAALLGFTPIHARSVTLPFTDHFNSLGNWGVTVTNKLGQAGIVSTDSASGSASSSLRYTYSQGYANGDSPAKIWITFSQTQELWTQYYFKYSSNFYLHRVVQKQAYWYISGDSSTNSNFFIGISGSALGDETRQVEAQLQRANVGATNRYISNTKNNPKVANNVWYKLTVHCKLNTNGQSNGILQVWLDDVLVMDYSNALYTSGSDANKPIGSFAFDPIFGGMGTEKKPQDDYFFVDYFQMSTTKIGDTSGGGSSNSGGSGSNNSGGGSTTSLTPMAPSNVNIR